jgi:hypothetical protein
MIWLSGTLPPRHKSGPASIVSWARGTIQLGMPFSRDIRVLDCEGCVSPFVRLKFKRPAVAEEAAASKDLLLNRVFPSVPRRTYPREFFIASKGYVGRQSGPVIFLVPKRGDLRVGDQNTVLRQANATCAVGTALISACAFDDDALPDMAAISGALPPNAPT